jgi:ketosteroid isomerase-like protein
MTKAFPLFIILTFFYSCTDNKAASIETKPALRDKLEKLKSIFISTTINDNVDERMKYYIPEALSMPEYQPMMKGVDAIKKYYTEIFRRQKVKAFEKQITEVIDLKGIVIEIGVFKMDYTTDTSGPIVHTGKYCNAWELQKDGSMLLQAVGWGYFQYIQNPSALVVREAIMNTENDSVQYTKKDADVLFELNALNALNENLVKSRNGRLQAEFYAEDGIYMPFADTMKVGREGIRKHLIGYTSGGGIVLDSIRVYTYQFKVLGEYVIEYSKFFVKWTRTESSGTTQGKGMRIWKRTAAGPLKLYRQLGIHDEIVK